MGEASEGRSTSSGSKASQAYTGTSPRPHNSRSRALHAGKTGRSDPLLGLDAAERRSA